MINKNIENHNSKGQYHGIQEWYENNALFLRGNIKNGERKGYIESHWCKEITFYIR